MGDYDCFVCLLRNSQFQSLSVAIWRNLVGLGEEKYTGTIEKTYFICFYGK